MFDALADWMTIPLLQHEAGKPSPRTGMQHSYITPYGLFKTRDGGGIVLSVQHNDEFRSLCAACSTGHRSRTTRALPPTSRAQATGSSWRRLEQALSAQSREEARRRCDASKIAYGFLNGMPELAAHPQLSAVREAEAPVEVVAPPVKGGPGRDELGLCPRESTRTRLLEFAAPDRGGTAAPKSFCCA